MKLWNCKIRLTVTTLYLCQVVTEKMVKIVNDIIQYLNCYWYYYRRMKDIIVLKKCINYDRGDTAIIKSKLKCREVI